MNITEEQMLKLIDLTVRVAADYQGMGLWRIRENAGELAEQINRAALGEEEWV